MKMNWLNWRRGLVVSALTGIATGLIGLSVGMGWRAACLFLAAQTAKDLLLFLSQHPLTEVTDGNGNGGPGDGGRIGKENNEPKT